MATFNARGHQPATAVVRRAVISERPPHALLLSGPPRVGKTTLALDLCAGLLCLAVDVEARPCRDCLACRKVDGGYHPDVHRLAPEGAGQQIRLGQVQSLVTELALLPGEGRYRIAIIEQAQRLNLDAQNALLKTLEEPQPKVVLVLAADEPHGLLPTVASRCARLRVGPVATATVAELLLERGLADAARADAIARASAGSVGAAMDLAAQPELLLVRGRLARSLLDLLGAERRVRLGHASALLADGALLAGSGGAESTSERERGAPAERRAAAARLLSVWRDLARDLALATQGAVAELRARDLIDDLAKAGRGLDGGEIAGFVERIDAASRALEAYANPELLVDALLLEWPTASPGVATA